MQEKKCQNCKHYITYYIKQNYRFKAISGICKNHTRRSDLKLCDDWVQAIDDKEKQYQSISNKIDEMSKNLQDIAEFVKNI